MKMAKHEGSVFPAEVHDEWFTRIDMRRNLRIDDQKIRAQRYNIFLKYARKIACISKRYATFE